MINTKPPKGNPEDMSAPGEGQNTKQRGKDHRALAPAMRLASMELGAARPRSPEEASSPQRPRSTDLPASLALPLARSRSSTPSSGSPLRGGPSTSVDDDSASVRSFVPTLSAGDDLEAMLSEMLGSDTRWRLDQDDDIDLWEGLSEGESDSDSGSGDEPEDDGAYDSCSLH